MVGHRKENFPGCHESGSGDCLLKTQDFAKPKTAQYGVRDLPGALKLKERIYVLN
jgi:hypothetical protein